MPERDIENPETEPVAPKRRRRLSLRNLMIVAGLAVVALAVFFAVSLVSFRYGVFDGWVKTQFTSKMADIGIVFSADEFALTVSPLELHLVNATFDDRATG